MNIENGAIFQCQLVRFLIVGGINTLVGYGFFVALLYIGVSYLPSYWLSMIIGVIVSYVLNKFYTFNKRSFSFLELARFLSVYAVSFAIGTVLLFLFVDIVGIGTYMAGGINLFFTTLISWFGHKYFSFRMTNVV